MSKQLFALLFVCIASQTFLSSQNKYSLYGEVFDKSDKSLIIGAVVSIPQLQLNLQTDENGHFHLNNLLQDRVVIDVHAVGYQNFVKPYNINVDNHIIIYLERQDQVLNEVVVTNHKAIESTLGYQLVNKSFVFENNASNFAKTLSKLPGVESIDIGTGFSKPMIRGFGFNRLAVVDKGIAQQDQQWGADHGLEIDQFDIDEVLVHKGPSSLLFGSDAIGGVIEILPTRAPPENIYMGDVTIIGKSNNDLTGITLMNAWKNNKWFLKGRYTYQRYSDFRVPADHFNYLNTELPILNHRTKNTAGVEQNISGSIQYLSDKFQNTIAISNIYQKNGFFSGAHGIPNKDDLLVNNSYRSINMPYNTVNHFKVTDNFTLKINSNIEWKTDFGYQYNHRQEYSYFHTHYPNQSTPKTNRNLETDFRLHTYSLNSKVQIASSNSFIYTIGIQSSYQLNKISGYSFFLPQYYQNTIGGYGLIDYHINDKLTIMGGLRYDYGNINIRGYYDEVIAKYVKDLGLSQEQADRYGQRANAAKPHFNNYSGSIGVIYNFDSEHTWKINIGRSFRLPTANELAANGIHHGAFRYEEGNPKLKSEQGYQLDMDYTITKGIFSVSLSPYISYFTNFIHLDPSGDPSILPDAGQIYKYRESETFFLGGEYQIRMALLHHIDFYTSGQYVYNRNETTKYPLPFTPPFSMRNELSYSNKYKVLQSYRVTIEHQLYSKQNRIARGEEMTNGSNIFNIITNANFKLEKFIFSLNFQIQNIFNTKYLNHLSFYRKLNIPEPGRNIQLLLKIPFYNQ